MCVCVWRDCGIGGRGRREKKREKKDQLKWNDWKSCFRTPFSSFHRSDKEIYSFCASTVGDKKMNNRPSFWPSLMESFLKDSNGMFTFLTRTWFQKCEKILTVQNKFLKKWGWSLFNHQLWSFKRVRRLSHWHVRARNLFS